MKKIWILIFLPAFLMADIGKVTARHQLNIDQPFGLAMDGNDLLIADRSSGNLYRFSLESKSVTGETRLPCRHPMGIVPDSSGLWISDLENHRILHLNHQTQRVDRVISEMESRAAGLGWDGECLWITSGDTFSRLDPMDGTELQIFEGPGRDTTSIFHDGTYLWLSERYQDRIVCATPDGTIMGVLPSPGPYPAGIWRKGDRLWVLDYEQKALYELDISFNLNPYTLGEPHRRKVHFKISLTNRGPSDDVHARLLVCVGNDDHHQKILKPVVFFPQSLKFTRDQWDQQFSVCEGKVPALHSLESGFEADIETRDLSYFILPEWIKPLDAIPSDIRKQYLIDGHKLKLKDPFIQELAEKIVGQEKNPFWIAFKIHAYLHQNMEYKMTGGWNAAPTILKRGNGSCSEFTFSFIALARAAGLPARYEAGLVVRGDDGSIDRVYHRWVQVYLPPLGWVPVDPSRGKPATVMDVAQSFGSLSHRFFITTHSGGDSPLLGWTYNYNAFYNFTGEAVVDTVTEAKWYPLTESE